MYIAILFFYFCFIYLMFPETKRLSAEDASRVFDNDRKGRPLVKEERDAEKCIGEVHVDDGSCETAGKRDSK